MKYVLAAETELAPNTLLTFIVGLGKLYPSRRKICGGWTWRGPPPRYLPRTPTLLWPTLSGVLHPSISPPLPLNLFVISSQTLPPILASNIYDFLKSTLSVFPPSAHSCIPNSAHSLFLPLSIETLYFYVVISTSLRYLPSFFFCPQLCYFLLRMEDTFSLRSLGKWWLH